MDAFWTCGGCGEKNAFPNTNCGGCGVFKPQGWRPWAGKEADEEFGDPPRRNMEKGGTEAAAKYPVPSRRDRLMDLFDEIADECRGIMAVKNRDYAGGADDPFANFRASGIFGIRPELGIMMRCLDKFKRIEAFVNTGTLAVKDEPVRDAVVDVINYMVLLAGLMEERNEKQTDRFE